MKNYVPFLIIFSFLLSFAIRFKWHLVISLFVVSCYIYFSQKLHQPCDMPKYTKSSSVGHFIVPFWLLFCRSGGKTLKDQNMVHLLHIGTETWPHVFFWLKYDWTPVGLSECFGHRQWKRLVHCVATGVTDTKQHSEFHSTARNTEEPWQLTGKIFFFFILKLFLGKSDQRMGVGLY